MAVKPIRLFGDPVLRTVAEPVTTFDRELRQLVKDLTDTMHDEAGAGLAAPQIGVGLRVFAYDVDGVVGHLVNPKLEFPTGEVQDGEEGCLSIPGLGFDCRRWKDVIATGFDQYGDPMVLQGSDLMARCIQHETDHLDGILFVDRIREQDDEAYRAAMKAIREAEWFGAPPPQVKVSPHPLFGRAR